MFGRDWATSPRRYSVLAERDVRIPLPDGTVLVGDVFRPDTSKPVPVIAGFHPYNNEFQTGPVRPEGFSIQGGWPFRSKGILGPDGLAAAAVKNLLHCPVTGVAPRSRTLAREGGP
jgi:hypothetical protein